MKKALYLVLGIALVSTVGAQITPVTKTLASALASVISCPSGGCNIDSGTLYIDADNNRVGVGTTSPSTTFHANGAATFAGALSGITSLSASGNITTTNGSVASTNGDVSSSNGDVFSTNGSLGAGTNSPSQKLHVQDGIILSSTTSGFGRIHAYGSSGGCLMFRDTDNAGWTECVALNGTMSCASDADGVCDGT